MKSKAIIPFLIAISIFSFAAIFQNLKTNKPQPANPNLTYNQLWVKADSLSEKGLYKSAVDVVAIIKQKARTEKNNPQFVKAIIHSNSLSSQLDEDFCVNSIKDLEKEISLAKDASLKAILYSITAETYAYYFNSHYEILDRTEIANNTSTDITIWDKSMFYKVIANHYKLSLKDATVLAKIKITDYKLILDEINENTKIVERPSLYDILANRALQYFKGVDYAPKPIIQFENNLSLLSIAPEFIKTTIAFNDSLDNDFNIAKIYQNIIKQHSVNSKVDALIDWDIERLNYYKNEIGGEDKDSIYLSALAYLDETYKTSPASLNAAFEIANFWELSGESYDASSNPSAKMDKAKAMGIIESHIALFPKAEAVKKLEYLKAQILMKSINLELEEVNLPEKPFRSLLKYKNLNHLYVRIINSDFKSSKVYDQDESKAMNELLKQPVLKQFDYALAEDKDYQNHSCEIKIPEMQAGHYTVLFSNTKDFNYKTDAVGYSDVWVSNISYISKRNSAGDISFYVLNRTTGEPMPNVTAQLFKEKYDYKTRSYVNEKGEKYISDKFGAFIVPATIERGNFRIDFSLNNDRFTTGNSFYIYSNPNYKESAHIETKFYTDRAIYRPGQTIYFKGIILQTDRKDSVKIMPNYTTNVAFYDVNGQKLKELELISNEFGSINGSFVAPTGVLNGSMRISNGSGDKYVRVEEYKRPKFQVSVDDLKKEFKLNDSIEVTGNAKAYAGNNIDGAEVKYRVVRTVSYPYWWYWRSSSSNEKEIANGNLKTDDNGNFTVKFKALPDLSVSRESAMRFNYRIVVDVTDINGETHSATKNVSVSSQSLFVDVEFPDLVNAESEQKYQIKSTNINGTYVHSKGKITVDKLKQPENTCRPRLWSAPDMFLMNEAEYHTAFPNDVYKSENDKLQWAKEKQMFALDYDTKKDSILNLADMKNWAPGVYELNIESTDKSGAKVESKSIFTVFSPKAKTIPENVSFWKKPLKTGYEPGENAQILIGTKEKSLKVLYEIEHKGITVHSEWLTLSNEQRMIEIPVKEEYRGNFVVHFNTIVNNNQIAEEILMNVPYTNKQLDISFETFRNKLVPGQEEEWKIKIKGKNGDKILAEMLAGMYDASLDEFVSNTWDFNIYKTYYSQFSWEISKLNTHEASILADSWYNDNYLEGKYCPDLIGIENGYYGLTRGLGSGKANGSGGGNKKSTIMITSDEINLYEFKGVVADGTDAPNISAVVYMSDSEEKLVDKPSYRISKSEDNSSNITPRTNFNETAFFFPNLKTDENGSVVISFKVPESLTKWKFMGFAHTKDLKYGKILNEAVTQKDLMVFPNFPRYFREGDTLVVSAKISNLSQEMQKGEAVLTLSDASTQSVLNTQFKNLNNCHEFTADKGKSTVVEWKIYVPRDIQMVNCRVTAKSSNFSDGEEFVLPVLTNRMLVTETLPLPIRGNQSKIFTFDKLLNNTSSTLTNNKLTLEFTSNPAWYAVQALPYMMEYPYECAEQTFSRLYANGIASQLANSNPKIKQVFDSWSSYTPDALLSNLEKNQELKAVLLQETPWVMDAKNENEQKKKIALLFDINKMGKEFASAVRKLDKLQTPNGGWAWFPGMPDDRYITQHIVCGFGKLQKLGIDLEKENTIKKMAYSGVAYLDARIAEDYNWLKKHTKAEDMAKQQIGYTQIHYLYARSFFLNKKSIPSETKEAYNFYLNQAKKYWTTQSRYMQGLIAISAFRNGDTKTANDIIASFKETAQHSEEMGMYWKDISAGYYWYEAPIETQSLFIELFDEVANDEVAVEEMKIWLLKQKQTQNWKTTKATAEACYALLLRGGNWLANDGQVTIRVGNLLLDPENDKSLVKEAGTGYFKTSWNKDDISKEMGNIKVVKKSDGVAWGAAYWQYFEQLDKITPAQTPLQITKKLYIVTTTDRGQVLTPITDTTPIKVGDKVKVRIEIRTDRNMEYIHLKDMRAAGFEPINVLSGYKYQGGLGYYESTGDAATNFFISYLAKGTYVFEYPLRANSAGNFSNGVTSIQCMYAPEFAAHSEGIRININSAR